MLKKFITETTTIQCHVDVLLIFSPQDGERKENKNMLCPACNKNMRQETYKQGQEKWICDLCDYMVIKPNRGMCGS